MNGEINKIIGAGFGRTGTTSLRKALEILGFGPSYHMHELFSKPHHVVHWENALEGNPKALMHLMGQYGSMVDFPACSYYKELYELFPGSKVILVYREPEEWYESISNTIFQIDWDIWNTEHPDNEMLCRVGVHNKKLITQQTFCDLLSDERFCMDIYLQHIEEVKRSIPQDDLLIFELAEGWTPLCEYLGIKCPEYSFPYENKRKVFSSLIENSKLGA